MASNLTAVNLGDAASSSWLVVGTVDETLDALDKNRYMGSFVRFVLKGGEEVWINPRLVTYVREASVS